MFALVHAHVLGPRGLQPKRRRIGAVEVFGLPERAAHEDVHGVIAEVVLRCGASY